MPIHVVMPKKGNSVDECLLVEWRVHVGDKVVKGQVLCLIETDKAAFEVEAPAAGTVTKLMAREGDIVPVLTPIALIEEAKAKPAPAASKAPPPLSEVAVEVLPEVDLDAFEVEEIDSRPEVVEDVPISETVTMVAASPRARRYAERFGVDLAAIAGSGPGGRVLYRDIAEAVDRGAAVKASPLARELLAAGGQAGGKGTGIGGLVRARDVSDEAAPGSAPARAKEAPSQPEQNDDIATIPYHGIRKLIGERMRQSLAEHAQLTLNSSADATHLLALREELKKKGNGEKESVPSLTDIVCWVVAEALARTPEVNALFDRAAGVITRHRRVNLGVAVDTPRGLMVPVVPDADKLSLAEMSRSIRVFSAACREGSIDPDALSGGTFTVTNLGGLGVESFTPILNPPQAAILGVCAIVPRPVSAGRALRLQPRLGLSLTIDHQAVDGAPGARFLREIVRGVEAVFERWKKTLPF